MCGRYTAIFSDKMQLPDALAALVLSFKPRYNIAPQQTAPVIRVLDGKPVFEEIRWGFRPAWLKDKNKAQINARGETLFEKPMFKHSAINRRCLVLASGWYEWQKTGKVKQPFYFHLQNDPLFAFAGIWTTWHGNSEVYEDSYAVVTTNANPMAASVHGRMPVMLKAKECELWLNVDNKDENTLDKLLLPYSGGDLSAHPVSVYVNKPEHIGMQCVQLMKDF